MYVCKHNRLPTRRSIREFVSDSVFYKTFGSFTKAIEVYTSLKESNTSNSKPKNDVKDSLIETLKRNLSEYELKTLVASTSIKAYKPKIISQSVLENSHFKFLATGDSHIGHKQFREDWWNLMIQRAIDEKVDFAYHTGDILEGMSGRPGHVYELSEIGFEAQFTRARRLIQDVPFDIKFCQGNHDSWFSGKADQGICVGARLEEALDNFIFLGIDEADDIVNGVKIKLWHGNDGSSYAISYRTQKFVEMLYGGEKPNILLAGHSHKSLFYETRNVHVFETGTTCMQSSFMRGKKLAAHTGYWIVDVWTNNEGITRIRPEWNPFYY